MPKGNLKYQLQIPRSRGFCRAMILEHAHILARRSAVATPA